MMNTRQDNNIFPNHSSGSAKIPNDDQYHDLFLQIHVVPPGCFCQEKK